MQLSSSATEALDSWQGLESQLASQSDPTVLPEDLEVLSNLTTIVLEQAADSATLAEFVITSYSILDEIIYSDQTGANVVADEAVNSIRLALENATLTLAKTNVSISVERNHLHVVSIPIDSDGPVEVVFGRESVRLPVDAVQNTPTAGTAAVYQDAYLFDSEALATKVVSLTLDTDTSSLQADVVITFGLDFPETTPLSADLLDCRYWDEDEREWRKEGCQMLALSRDQLVCSCNHLTNFAGTLSQNTQLSQAHATNINLLSGLVSAMSVLMLTAVCIVLLACRNAKWFGHPQVGQTFSCAESC